MTSVLKQRIHDAIEACRAIQHFAEGVSFGDSYNFGVFLVRHDQGL